MSVCVYMSEEVADVWEKDVWDFQAKFGSSGSCPLLLRFLGKIAVKKCLGTRLEVLDIFLPDIRDQPRVCVCVSVSQESLTCRLSARQFAATGAGGTWAATVIVPPTAEAAAPAACAR